MEPPSKKGPEETPKPIMVTVSNSPSKEGTENSLGKAQATYKDPHQMVLGFSMKALEAKC